MKKFLQRIGILHTPTYEYTKYDVKVFVMSEGTAQGIPRPLQVFSTSFSWNIDTGRRYFLSSVKFHANSKQRIEAEIYHIVRNGYGTTLSNGQNVLYPSHTIFKVTYEICND